MPERVAAHIVPLGGEQARSLQVYVLYSMGTYALYLYFLWYKDSSSILIFLSNNINCEHESYPFSSGDFPNNHCIVFV